VSGNKGFFETIGEASEAGGTDGLLLSSNLGSLLLEDGGTVGDSGGNSLNFGGSLGLGVRVELLHHSLVLKRVSLGLVVEFVVGDVNSNSTELGLNLIGVDNTGEIGAVDDIALHAVSRLSLSLNGVGSENVIEGFESVTGEDDEASDGTTGGELEEVESVDVADINTGQVAGSFLDVEVGISVDDEGSSSVGETSISVFSLSSSQFLGLADTLKIGLGTEAVEGREESSGGVEVEGFSNKWEFGDIHNSVSLGKDEGCAGRGGKSGGNGVSLLVEVGFSVPFSPDLEGSEHATFTAHVTEGGLSRSVGTRSRNSGNTGDGATGTPRLSGMLMSLLPEDTVSLSSVLGHGGVAERDDIISDRGAEDSGHSGVLGGHFSFVVVDTDSGSAGHFLLPN